MNEKTLKFENIRINNKAFHKSKQPEDLASANVDEIVISSNFKYSDENFKYFIGYKKDEIVRPLCIILPQMKGYIKYFEKSSKNMSFFIKDDDVLYKYNEIWDKIKEKLNIKFHSEPIYDKKYIKAKVREYDSVIKTNFLGNKVPKENMRYTCIACLRINSVVRKNKKKYLQVYLEECKYKIEKIQMPRFINAELELEPESESGSVTESMAVLKSNSDFE